VSERKLQTKKGRRKGERGKLALGVSVKLEIHVRRGSREKERDYPFILLIGKGGEGEELAKSKPKWCCCSMKITGFREKRKTKTSRTESLNRKRGGTTRGPEEGALRRILTAEEGTPQRI